MTARRPYSEEDNRFLMESAEAGVCIGVIARHLGRSVTALKSRYRRLDMKPPHILDAPRRRPPTTNEFGGTEISAMRDRRRAEAEIAKLYGDRRYG